MTFNDERLKQFTDIPFQKKPFASARIPREWAKDLGIGGEDLSRFGLALASIPDGLQDRYQVREICRHSDTHVLIGYICAMAWGAQGLGPTRRHAQRAWAARSLLIPLLERIKAGGLSRAQAYDLLNKARIEGLGPSYFTKLIFFFMPLPDAYIMDQWTAKSINYLVGKNVVRLGGHAPSRSNTGAVYEEYCVLVEKLRDHLATLGELLTGEEVEQRIFSNGGRGAAMGAWRAIVRKHFGEGDDMEVDDKPKPPTTPPAPNETKADIARRIFADNLGISRKAMILLFIEVAGLTPKGAATYYYNIKEENLPSDDED